MLFNILLFMVLAMACLLPFFCFLSFRWGVRFGKKPEKAANQKIIPHILTKSERQQMKELDDMNKLLQNIDNYQGDSRGQVKI